LRLENRHCGDGEPTESAATLVCPCLRGNHKIVLAIDQYPLPPVNLLVALRDTPMRESPRGSLHARLTPDSLPMTNPERTEDQTAGDAAIAELTEAIALEAVTAKMSPRPDLGEPDEPGHTDAPTPGDAADFGAPATLDDPKEPLRDAGAPAGRLDPMLGRRLGVYRLTEWIGSGGLGNVYLATRLEDYEQHVAVKLIKRGMDSEVIVRHFRTEIHVHAALGKHANIAGLLDAGTANDGRPYFVMEYIAGQRIDDYCDSRRLDVPARLRLFAQVCDAVQFAHQHAVIHRDLKPNNILVTAEGMPKLIDFGIAKLIDPAGGGDAAVAAPRDFTQTGERVLTPEYASPEQVEGEPATTASDVYALAVVLYQLLTGRLPYRFKGQSVFEVFQAICEQAPERPSLAVLRRTARRARSQESPLPTAQETTAPASSEPPATAPLPAPAPESAARGASGPSPEKIAAARGTHPAGLKRALAGDLDMIVLMALRKEPDRRYASAGQLADDLRRHLEGQPVVARGDSPIYRIGKFVRRHVAHVIVGAAALVALLLGVVGTTTGLVIARRERDRAEASSRHARHAVDQFLTRVSEERLLDQPGLHELRRDLLEDAQRFYQGFVAEHRADSALRADLAAALARLAQINATLGSLAEADAQYERAVAHWDGLHKAHPKLRQYQEELARTLSDHADLLVQLKGRSDQALGAADRARALLEPLASGPSAPISTRHELGKVLQRIATLQFETDQPDQAVAMLERAIEIHQQLAAGYPTWLEPRVSLAQAYSLLGLIRFNESDGMARAIESFQRAVDTYQAVVDERPGLVDAAYRLAMDLGNLGMVQRQSDKLDSAKHSNLRAIEVLERLERQYPGVLNYERGLATTYNMQSDLHRRRLEPSDSLAFAEKARDLLERLSTASPGDVGARNDLAKSYNNIARVHQQAGETSEAQRSFQRAIDLYESAELDSPNIYNLACNLALCVPLIGAREGSLGVNDPEGLPKKHQLRRELYAARAVEALRKAVRAGFVNMEVLQSDPDLLAIRNRDDFDKLIKEIEKQRTENGKR
jgi:serine/threonine protein kinase